MSSSVPMDLQCGSHCPGEAHDNRLAGDLLPRPKSDRFCSRTGAVTPIGSERSRSGILGQISRREVIAPSRSASVRIFTEPAIRSNGSSIKLNGVGGSRRDDALAANY